MRPGSERYYRGTVLRSQNPLYTHILRTQMEDIPLILRDGDQYLEKQVRMLVRFVGKGRNFDIARIDQLE